jgi:hypothetical protein
MPFNLQYWNKEHIHHAFSALVTSEPLNSKFYHDEGHQGASVGVSTGVMKGIKDVSTLA